MSNKKLLFIYNERIKKDSLGNYYSHLTTNEMLERYKILTKDISVALPVEKSDDVNKDNLLKNIKVNEMPKVNTIKTILFNRRKLKDFLKTNIKQNDIIIIRIPSLYGDFAIKYSRKFKKKYILEVAGCPWDAYWNHSLKGKLIAPFAYFKMKNHLKKSEYSIYVTEKFLQERYPTNGYNTNISNVILNNITELSLIDRLDRINKQGKNIILGTIGNLDVKYKGHEYVIKAISKIKNNINYEYQIIGGGNKIRLEKLAIKYNVIDKVKFLGTLPHDKIFEWLDNIDIYIQPSKQEGLPRSVIEAMSRATPVIGSNIAGIPELLEEDFIFNIKNNGVKNLIKLLASLDKKQQINMAKRNFHESHKYSYQELRKRRNDFFNKFKDNWC